MSDQGGGGTVAGSVQVRSGPEIDAIAVGGGNQASDDGSGAASEGLAGEGAQLEPDNVRAAGIFVDCPHVGQDAADIARVLGFGSPYMTFEEFETALKAIVGDGTDIAQITTNMGTVMNATNASLEPGSRVSPVKIAVWASALPAFLARRFRSGDEQQHTASKSTISKRAYRVRRAVPASAEAGSQAPSVEDVLMTLPELLPVWREEGYAGAVLRRNGEGHLPEEEFLAEAEVMGVLKGDPNRPTVTGAKHELRKDEVSDMVCREARAGRRRRRELGVFVSGLLAQEVGWDLGEDEVLVSDDEGARNEGNSQRRRAGVLPAYEAPTVCEFREKYGPDLDEFMGDLYERCKETAGDKTKEFEHMRRWVECSVKNFRDRERRKAKRRGLVVEMEASKRKRGKKRTRVEEPGTERGPA